MRASKNRNKEKEKTQNHLAHSVISTKKINFITQSSFMFWIHGEPTSLSMIKKAKGAALHTVTAKTRKGRQGRDHMFQIMKIVKEKNTKGTKKGPSQIIFIIRHKKAVKLNLIKQSALG